MFILSKVPRLHQLLDILHEIVVNILCFWGFKRRNVPDKSIRMDGQTVIVTGGNKGFGYGITKDLVSRGARVIVACRDIARASELVEEIKEMNSSASVSIKHLDLSSFKSVKSFSAEIIREESRIDVLINNAGVITKDKTLMTEDGNERTVQVNHLSHALLTINLIHKMRSTSEDPRIVFVSSLAHHKPCEVDLKTIPKDYWTAYALSKVAMMMFAQKMRSVMHLKNDPLVRIYVVDPGIAPTEIMPDLHEKTKNNWFVKSPLFQQIVRTPMHGSTSILCPLFFDKSKYEENFYSKDGHSKTPNVVVSNRELSQKIWEQTFEILDLPQI